MSVSNIRLTIEIPTELSIDIETFCRIPGITIEVPTQDAEDGGVGILTTIEIPVIDGHEYGNGGVANLLLGFISMVFLSTAKGYNYKDSWKNHGLTRSIMSNIDRKYDRLSNAVDNNFTLAQVDSAGDMSVYGLMAVFDYFRNNHPEEFSKWWETEVIGYIKDQYLSSNEFSNND